MTTTIYLLRHGDVHNPQKILYGRRPDFRLSDLGREQAVAARDALRDKSLTAIFSSPQQRAQETAAIIAEPHTHLTVTTDPRIDEVLTPREGEPLAELEKTNFDLYSGNQPPYEVQGDVLKRVHHFFTHLRENYAGQEVAAVTHGDIVAFMFLYAKGTVPEVGTKGQMQALGLPEVYPATASISTFTYKTDDVDELPAFAYLRPY